MPEEIEEADHKPGLFQGMKKLLEGEQRVRSGDQGKQPVDAGELGAGEVAGGTVHAPGIAAAWGAPPLDAPLAELPVGAVRSST